MFDFFKRRPAKPSSAGDRIEPRRPATDCALQSVLGIPGQWADQKSIVAAVAQQSDGYLFAGSILMHVETRSGFVIEVQEHNPKLSKSFAIASRGRLTDMDLQAIAAHTFTLYIVSRGGSLESARTLMRAGHALLKSGGLAVKVESAGTAHSAGTWARFSAEDDVGVLFQAYVQFVSDRDDHFSCGMHNMGLPDVIVPVNMGVDDATELLYSFCGYLLLENPDLNSGETFSVSPDAPLYRLFHERCTRFQPDDLFHNPFGAWRLRAV